MRVLFINRETARTVYGGDTVQMNYTADSLRKLGVEVDIDLTFDNPDYSKYDLIHFFNITRPDNILFHLSRTDRPFVVSTILTDYSFYKKINSKFRLLAFILGVDGIEYLKSVLKHILGKEKLKSLDYILTGQNKSIKQILDRAEYCLPNSENEYRRLVYRYGKEVPYEVIPNGVDLHWKIKKATERKQKTVLCVARVEPLKNQLNLIRALKNSEFALTILGKPSPHHQDYYQKCIEEADAKVKFIRYVEEDQLMELYAESEMHILPSWFETTGLSSLEAAYFGCKIVVSNRGDAPDYFKDMAEFCEPDDPSSILEAIRRTHKNNYKNTLKKKIIEEYNWDSAAQKTLNIYKKVLNTKK